MNLSSLRAGAVVSFSAGSDNSMRLVGRTVLAQTTDPLTSIASQLPHLAEWLGGSPVVIQAYPAHLSTFPSAIFIDSYLRPTNVARGLRLATELGASATIVAQPLVAAHLLTTPVTTDATWPRRLLLAMGGYACPLSLENALIQLGSTRGCELRVLHAYGCAEVAPAMLIGVRDDSGQVLYHRRCGVLRAQQPDGQLFLGTGDDEGFVATGDHLLPCGAGYRIVPGPTRQAEVVTAELSRWGAAEWRRRTGHLHLDTAGMSVQLREAVSPETPGEVEHHEFCRRHAMSWLDKPRWSRADHPLATH